MEFKDIKASEIIFKELIADREYCSIFLIALRGKTCVMKVHHGREPWRLPLETEDREYNIFKCESAAYRRLTEAGVCSRGITPQFYGTMKKIDSILCLPHLRKFLKDEFPPTAIFLEYIPNMTELHWSNYTPKRMKNFIDGMSAIHDAHILHNDVYPRNMMIVDADTEKEREIWIDFDRAQTYPDELTDLQKEWIEDEQCLVVCIDERMAHDAKLGDYDRTRIMY